MDFHPIQNAFQSHRSPPRNSFFNLPLQIKLLIILISFLCLFNTHTALAKKHSILIITDNRINIHNNINTRLKDEFKKNSIISVQTQHFQNLSIEPISDKTTSLIITLGTKAAAMPLPASIPTINTLIAENNQQAAPAITTNKYSIYLDQPIARQLNFLNLLLPSATNIGVLTTDFSATKLPSLKTESSKLNLTLHSRSINKENNLNRELNQLIENIDVLLALPDPKIHNRENIPFLLLSTYRYNIPVIGFSKTYVHAGAIAAIYSSPAQITRQITELSLQIINASLPTTSHSFSPKYFSITSNSSVANSLGIQLPSTQEIKSKLLLLEK